MLFYLVDQKFTCAQVCERNLPRAQWLRECQVHSVGNGYPSLPTICTHFTDTHCSMTLCYTHSIHWSQSKGSSCSPFSASNCDIPCHDSLRGLYLPISSLSASILQSFCSSLACGASILTTPDLTPKNGGFYLPFSASNCASRCHILLGESPSCAHMGFYQQLYHLSVDCGGSTPPIEFWSWISSTLTLDGFHCPLRMMNWVSLRNLSLFTCHVVDLPSELLYLFTRKFSAISCMALSWLVFLTCIFLIDTCLRATSVHGSDDDSTHKSPLPNACTHSTFSIDASLFISLIVSTCILSIDTCLLAICERGVDDASHVSPLHLPTTCIHSTFSTVACFLFGIFSILIVATCLDAHGALGLDDFVYNSPLPTACTSSTLAFAIALLVSLHDLSVTESSTDSTLFRLLLLAVMLWQDALAKVKGILLSLYHSFRWSASPQDSDESTGATCTFVRSVSGTSGSGRDSRNPPLPSLLWHFALAILHDIIVNLIRITFKNSLASMCRFVADSLNMSGSVASSQFTSQSSLDDIDSSIDIEQSIQATCTSPRLNFSHLSSGWDLRSPPLPSSVTIVTTQIAEEDALTWASNINSEESLPLSSTNSPHCSDDFAAACTFLTTFTPSFHHTECPDEDGFLPPMLDTGATHCLLPLRWMTIDQAGSAKQIHLHVASGSKVRALLHDLGVILQGPFRGRNEPL